MTLRAEILPAARPIQPDAAEDAGKARIGPGGSAGALPFFVEVKENRDSISVMIGLEVAK